MLLYLWSSRESFSYILFQYKQMITRSKIKNKTNQKGFSLPELIVVLLIIAILVVLALPQMTASRRLFRFAGLQRQVAASLNEARQESMSQRAPISFRYDDTKKQTIIYGGSFGAAGASTNKVVEMSGSGLEAADIAYGRPSGATTSALSDTSKLTALSNKLVNITFSTDGSVVDAAGVPVNNALYFYNQKNPQESAFAVSILGAGGRVKLYRYNKTIKTYVE